jgi:hypothetical protein
MSDHCDLFAEAHRDIDISCRLREQAHPQVLDEKTRPAREAAGRERRMRAELHRIAALQPLSDRLARVVLDEVERQGRVLVKAQLADSFHAELLRSGLWQDPRFPPRRA